VDLINSKTAALILLLGGKVKLGRFYSMNSVGLEVKISNVFNKEVARKNLVQVHEHVWVRLELQIPGSSKERRYLEKRFSQHVRNAKEPMFLVENTAEFEAAISDLQGALAHDDDQCNSTEIQPTEILNEGICSNPL